MNISEEAALGVLEEVTRIGKRHEAEWLAEQLKIVKHFDRTSIGVLICLYFAKQKQRFVLSLSNKEKIRSLSFKNKENNEK